MSESELRDAIREGRLFGLEVDGVLYLPAFFAERTLNRDWLEDVTLLMGNLSGAQKWVFFTRPKGSLSGNNPPWRPFGREELMQWQSTPKGLLSGEGG